VTVDSVAPHISVSWFSDTTNRIRDILGENLWKKMIDVAGGSTLYIPLRTTYYQRRNEKIRSFARNHTTAETAKRFCLSPRQVKRILSA
jgi:AraC-like DNA-binding protein